jgi:hypothetical protein
MIKARKDGLLFLLLGCAIFLLMGTALEMAAPVSTVDFRIVYYSARCLLDHRDPYNENEVRRTYQIEGGVDRNATAIIEKTETQYIYFPTAFPITVPFALLPFGAAHILWLAATAVALILGGILMWEASSGDAPLLAGALIGLLLANCELFLALGNPGGIGIGLCVVAVWCFIRDRYVAAGIVCMALSLMLKPHNPALVWSFFLLAGGVYRKRALQTLLVIFVLAVPSVLWTFHIAPQWPSELIGNLVGNGAHGSLSDPGPKSLAGHGIGMMINLQTALSVIRDDPRFYNPAAYLICGSLVGIWIWTTLRLQLAPWAAWLGVAPISILTMLPIYHRLYDAKMILIAIPALAMLWVRKGTGAWVGLLLTLAAIVLTSGFPWAIFFQVLKHVSAPNTTYTAIVLTVLQTFPAPLILLSCGIYYLQAYVTRDRAIRSDA